jgi:hypothetical protein
MAGATSRTGDPFAHRAGIRVQRMQDPADSVAGNHDFDFARLGAIAARMDFLACDRDARTFSGDFWRVAGGRQTAPSHVCLSGVLRAGILHGTALMQGLDGFREAHRHGVHAVT